MKRTPLIIIGIFITMIFAIPALIVLPFTDPKESEGVAVQARAPAAKATDPAVAVTVSRHETNKVQTLSLRDYLIGVVASEMPAEFQSEALKAQALAARTYIVKILLDKGERDNNDPIVSDTPTNQVFKSRTELKKAWGADYGWKIKKIEKAVDATAGQVLTYDGQLISPSFFSTSNGYTENAEDYWKYSYPYLKSVKSPWDLKSPKYKKTVALSVQAVEKALNIRLPKTDGPVGSVMKRTAGKRVASFKIGGKTFTGREIRESLNLRSTDFSMVRQGSEVLVTTKGYGHGVGMSQYGANGMAEEGKDYKAIVKYFYKGVAVSDVSPFLKELNKK